jgi:hypothetical protein
MMDYLMGNNYILSILLSSLKFEEIWGNWFFMELKIIKKY